jgi:hypothetical protein
LVVDFQYPSSLGDKLRVSLSLSVLSLALCARSVLSGLGEVLRVRSVLSSPPPNAPSFLPLSLVGVVGAEEVMAMEFFLPVVKFRIL